MSGGGLPRGETVEAVLQQTPDPHERDGCLQERVRAKDDVRGDISHQRRIETIRGWPRLMTAGHCSSQDE